MQATITIGDKTTHGGVVTEVDNTFIVQGKAAHLQGMKHFCPKCKTMVSAIASNSLVTINGKAMIVAGDKTTCGATFVPGQSLVGKAQGAGSSSGSSNIFSSSSSSSSIEDQLNSSYIGQQAKTKVYYVDRNETDVFISHKAIIMPFDEGVQGLSGAVSYFLNYVLTGRDLFISVMMDPKPIIHSAKIHPYGKVTIKRKGEDFGTTRLQVGSGVWNTEKGKIPLGSCTIELPEPNIQLVEVELELGYTARPNDSVGFVTPIPPYKKHKFTLTSFAR
ncbi:hypothetical protein AMD27_08435 [Acinetobacter sp. TGL-Y2]|uniref:PAAR domain-containing protein n=1 Tax=Acinetobacter sp. TGL-Y2 TaxID=1407071 RepID=UPI0007A651BA|nr:PAAR domain-containing protein [Acinetobacter sp. TGL-Y2]AMW78901.1 hypothetical protein AMD27_08435 [Acinetobacter sp. TGL-Y2]